jgi:hypothetical protein
MDPLRATIRKFDDWLSQQYRVQVFSEDPLCILRIQTRPLRHSLELPDCNIERGSQALMVHFWNERASLIPSHGPSIAWALTTCRQVQHSLQLIAQHIQTSPACKEITAVGGVTAHIVLGKESGGRAMLEHLGFVVIPYQRPMGAFGEFWENFYTWWLMWTFNPASTRKRSMFNLQRAEFWMSRQAFLDKYGK